MKKFSIIITLVASIAFVMSCEKEPGFGGTSTIVGKVKVRDYNANFTLVNSVYWAQEEDVYLVFGKDSIYTERFKTNYDGSYWFQYLTGGEYTIYAYSKDSTLLSPSGKIPVQVKVNISDNGKTFEAPLITILD